MSAADTVVRVANFILVFIANCQLSFFFFLISSFDKVFILNSTKKRNNECFKNTIPCIDSGKLENSIYCSQFAS